MKLKNNYKRTIFIILIPIILIVIITLVLLFFPIIRFELIGEKVQNIEYGTKYEEE